jgi:hypothetical protein
VISSGRLPLKRRHERRVGIHNPILCCDVAWSSPENTQSGEYAVGLKAYIGTKRPGLNPSSLGIDATNFRVLIAAQVDGMLV